MVSKVLVHGHLNQLFLVYSEAVHHGREQIVEQNCSPDGRKEAEKERNSGMRDKLFKSISVTHFLLRGPILVLVTSQ
jgi:hypothetical protein